MCSTFTTQNKYINISAITPSHDMNKESRRLLNTSVYFYSAMTLRFTIHLDGDEGLTAIEKFCSFFLKQEVNSWSSLSIKNLKKN